MSTGETNTSRADFLPIVPEVPTADFEQYLDSTSVMPNIRPDRPSQKRQPAAVTATGNANDALQSIAASAITPEAEAALKAQEFAREQELLKKYGLDPELPEDTEFHAAEAAREAAYQKKVALENLPAGPSITQLFAQNAIDQMLKNEKLVLPEEQATAVLKYLKGPDTLTEDDELKMTTFLAQLATEMANGKTIVTNPELEALLKQNPQ